MTSSTSDNNPNNERSKFLFSAKEEAERDWKEFGYYSIPYRMRSKGPRDEGWINLPQEAVDPISRFNGGHENRGVITGSPSRGLADVDLDCHEAVLLATRCLVQTAIFGRPTNQRSHWLYVIDEEIYREFTDPLTRQRLLELRGTHKHQTVFPGSYHQETGERIDWDVRCSPFRMSKDELLQRCGILASGCLFMRAMPPAGVGARHDAALRLGGFLARCSWTEEQIKRYAGAIFTALGDEKDIHDRVTAAVAGSQRLAEGDERTYGLPGCNEVFGEIRMRKIAEWLSHPAIERERKREEDDDENWGAFETINAATVRMENVRWLIPGLLPLGCLTSLSGNPKVGKSTLLCAVVAITTTGNPWPGSPDTPGPQAGRTIWIETEDSPKTTIVPRLVAAGADLKMVEFIRSVSGKKNKQGLRRGVDITRDLTRLEEVLKQFPDTSVVVLNPLQEFLGTKVDSHNYAKIRAALGPMIDFAERFQVSIIGVAHLAKVKQGSVTTASMGSTAFTAIPRVNLLMDYEPNPDEDAEQRFTGRRLLTIGGGNLSADEENKTTAWKLETVYVHNADDSQFSGSSEIKTSRAVYDGEVGITAHELWEDKPKKRGRPATASDEVADLIKSLLFSHHDDSGKAVYQERDAAEVKALVMRAGHSPATYERVKSRLGLSVVKGVLKIGPLNEPF